jgi:nucleotide-binding universal stress UspA family protein
MKILIAYDGSSFADKAIEDLRRAGLPANVEALIVCVADGTAAHPDAVAADKTDEAGSWRSRLAEAERLAEDAGSRILSYFPSWTISSEALWGSPGKVILTTAEWWHPDLVVAGSHGRSGFARFFLGSVSLSIVSKAACSVRVARSVGRNDGVPLRTLVGYDGSEAARAAVRAVAARCWPKNAEAEIISAAQTIAPVTTELDASTFAQEPAYSVIRDADEQARRRLAKIAAECEDALRGAGLVANFKVIDGDPREVIVCEAERFKADAVFVGARGHGRMERLLLGSVSNYVVTHATCSVEVVRPSHAENRYEK